MPAATRRRPHTRRSAAAAPAMPKRCRSPTIRSRSATGSSCRSTSRSPTTRPSSTGRAGHRHPVPLHHLPAEGNQAASPRPISPSSTRPNSTARHRHHDRERRGLLPGRGLSSGLSDPQPRLPLHRLQRPAENRDPEAPVPLLYQAIGPGLRGGSRLKLSFLQAHCAPPWACRRPSYRFRGSVSGCAR